MFRALTIENFKCIGDVQEIPLAPITLIFGPNSGGKSTIIQSLLLLKQSLWEGYSASPSDLLRMQGPLTNLGSFNAAVHKHDTGRPVAFSVRSDALIRTRKNKGREMTLPDGTRMPEGKIVSVTTSFQFGLPEQKEGAPELTKVCYGIEGTHRLAFEFERPRKSQKSTSKRKSDAEFAGFYYTDEEPRFVISNRGVAAASLMNLFESDEARLIAGLGKYEERSIARARASPTEDQALEAEASLSLLLRGLGRPTIQVEDSRGSKPARLESDPIAGMLDAVLRGTSDIASRHFRQMSYLGPLRTPPERYYIRAEAFAGTVGIRGENVMSALVADNATIRRQRERELNEWLKRLGINYRLAIRILRDVVAGEIYVLELLDLNRDIPVGPSDIGFGFSQLLPIIVEGLLTPAPIWGPRGIGHAICIEQPEIHLHPRLQAELSDFLIHTASISRAQKFRARSPNQSVQWIIETHSEALMLRVQRRIREREIAPADICVLYVHPGADGESKVIRLRLDDDGDFIDEWPGGFFEEGYREKFAPTPDKV